MNTDEIKEQLHIMTEFLIKDAKMKLGVQDITDNVNSLIDICRYLDEAEIGKTKETVIRTIEDE